jgi:hypothetical protein
LPAERVHHQKVVTAYKFVTDDLKSCNGDIQWVVGEWQKHNEKLCLCDSGFHACINPLDSLKFIYGASRWFIVAAKGDFLYGGDKFCCSEMKLVAEIPVREVTVPFAIACARRCYKNWKCEFPDDNCVLAAIRAAEKCFASPTQQNIDSARSAARSAENAAGNAENAARNAESAVWNAESAAGSAARSAAGNAENAAGNAENAARSAVWSAAGNAEGAVWSAAWRAERDWQIKKLKRLITKTITEA